MILQPSAIYTSVIITKIKGKITDIIIPNSILGLGRDIKTVLASSIDPFYPFLDIYYSTYISVNHKPNAILEPNFFKVYIYLYRSTNMSVAWLCEFFQGMYYNLSDILMHHLHVIRSDLLIKAVGYPIWFNPYL